MFLRVYVNIKHNSFVINTIGNFIFLNKNKKMKRKA